MIPNHAVETAVAQADSLRARRNKRWDEWVTLELSFEHDWPVEALAQLAQRLREHYIHLEVRFPETSQPTE